MIRSTVRRLTFGRWPEVRPGDPLSCSEVGRRLQRYLDGELDHDAECDALEVHLEECRRCGLEAETYRSIKASLARRCEPVSPESLARLRAFGERLAGGG
jgi:anti-sigma factor (TIGR02949 family)